MNLSGMPVGWGSQMGGSMFRTGPFSPTLGRQELGQNEQQWFARAKASVAQYDELWAKTQQIGNKAYREQLASKYHTTPEDRDGALYRRNSVAYNISEAESHAPVKYAIFGESQQQNRVSKLETWNRDFKKDIDNGVFQYGLLEASEPIEKVATINQSETPSWLIPTGLGLGAFVLGLILFKG